MAMNYRIYVDTGVGGFAELPVPSGMSCGLYGISAENAGRTEATVMMKNLLGVAPKIELTYANRDTATITTVLGLVKNEYFSILYQDLRNGGEYAYGEFYCGDVSTQVYNGALDVWSSTKFSLIKRDGKAGVPCVLHTSTSLPTAGDSFTVDLSLLGNTQSTNNVTTTGIDRVGSIAVAVDNNDNRVGVITRGSGAEPQGTAIFKNANGQTIIVEVGA